VRKFSCPVDSSLDNLDDSGHIFVAVTAKDIAEERKCTGFVRNEPYVLGNSRFDVNPNVKLSKLESVVTVPARKFQQDRHAFPHRDLTRFEFKTRRGYPNDLFVAPQFLRGGSDDALLM
jgi:hypothetical protein